MVVADEFMKKNTLITEYIGEVDILAKNEQNSNDSIMDLLRTGYIRIISFFFFFSFSLQYIIIYLLSLSVLYLSTQSLHDRDSSTSLVIIPEKIGNVARYLSGVNNSKEESMKKQVDY